MPLRPSVVRALALLAGLTAAPASQAASFDFFVLSLSWSPTYCATDDDPDDRQCGQVRGFVTHGLWPQFERGYPDYCESDQPRWLDQRVIDANADLFPNPGLAIHQWRKHGMCAGLPQDDYFDLIREAVETVTVPAPFGPGAEDKKASPETVERLFVEANDGLTTGGMSVQCRDGLMSEVRICLTRDLDFRACDEVDADRCRAGAMVVPSVR